MSTASPATKPPVRRRWLRRIGLTFLLVLLLAAGGVWYAATHLTPWTRWALERAFPGARVELHQVNFHFPNSVEIDVLTLTSRRDGEPLLSLAKGQIGFQLEDLWQRRIGEIRLEQPVLHVSPRLSEAFQRPASSGKPSSPPWSVRRLTCDYGEIHVGGYGEANVTVSAKFAWDFQDFSPVSSSDLFHELVLWDVVAATPTELVLSLDTVRLGFQFTSLFQNRTLSSVDFSGGSLLVGKSLREIFSGPPMAASTNTSESPWILGQLDLKNLRVRFDNERPEWKDIRFAVNLTLRQVPLSQAAAELGHDMQTVEIANLVVLSPLDPFTRILSLDSLFVRFTLGGLLRREISEITILGPAVYVGPDLFWYMAAAKKSLTPPENGPTNPAGPGWTIQTIHASYGRLVLGSGGRKQYGLPLNFQTTAKNISLDNLAALKLQAELKIPPQKYAFESYQLAFETQEGNLRFSYPPKDSPDNLVGTIQLTDLRWRQYQADQAWVSVTFDQQGINGKFGAKIYRGETTGGFSFTFGAGTPWVGWLSGDRIDLKKLTNIIAPQNIRLTGPLQFRTQIQARGKSIDQVTGECRLDQPGNLKISKLDDILNRIPDTWTSLKKDGTRILLETLRDFDYTQGTGDFRFINSQGSLQLQLQGPAGSRNFEIVLHPASPWKLPVAHP